MHAFVQIKHIIKQIGTTAQIIKTNKSNPIEGADVVSSVTAYPQLFDFNV